MDGALVDGALADGAAAVVTELVGDAAGRLAGPSSSACSGARQPNAKQSKSEPMHGASLT
jgi:hypothetical protein